MGTCNVRMAYLSLCALHLITTIIRQVFDFLGFMWAPILTNFINIIFIIFGYYGAFQYAFKYVVSYLTWSIIWLAWNIFVICFYLNVGSLNRESDALALGTDSISWWCTLLTPYNSVNGSLPIGINLPISRCGVTAAQIEVGQASAAIVCTLLIIILAFLLPSEPPCKLSKNNLQRSIYSIELGSAGSVTSGTLKSGGLPATEAPQKPMTPRRVKRRAASQRPPRPPRAARPRHRAPSPPPSPARSAYSSYHAPRPASYHPPAPPGPPALPGPPAYRLRPSSSLDTFM